MLRLNIVIGETETFDEATNRFTKTDGETFIVDLEHSLVSLSKWEAIYKVPFLSDDKKTEEQLLDYLKCMIVDPNMDPNVLLYCTKEDLDRIQGYIDSKESATVIPQQPSKRGARQEKITSELIYYWMSAYQIPFAPAETWHLNRLFSLIQVANVKNSKPKKMSRHEIAQRNREINEERRARLGTSG